MNLKNQLTNGTIVEIKNKDRYILINKTLVNLKGGHLDLDDYDDDLKDKSKYDNIMFEIVKFNNNTERGEHVPLAEALLYNEWTWERSAEILDKKEKEYLSAVIKPFKNKVDYIKKVRLNNGKTKKEYISIYLNTGEYITLLYFEVLALYKGMEPSVHYTLEELKL